MKDYNERKQFEKMSDVELAKYAEGIIYDSRKQLNRNTARVLLGSLSLMTITGYLISKIKDYELPVQAGLLGMLTLTGGLLFKYSRQKKREDNSRIEDLDRAIEELERRASKKNLDNIK